MKLRILQIALFIPAISLFSQDWQLFPYKQTGYYRQGMTVEAFTMDSVAKYGKDSVMYFNAEWNINSSSELWQAIGINNPFILSLNYSQTH